MKNDHTEQERCHEHSSWEDAQRQRDEDVQKAIRERECKGGGLGDIQTRHHYWGPWLLIRGSTADTGARPVPSNQPYWASPDIIVESGDPQGRAIAGRPNFVWARIWNLHRALAAPVRVDYYWANPAVGLGPGHVNSISGDKPEWVMVPPLSSVWVKCKQPWVPTFLNDGHECLFVNCDNHLLDPIIHPSEPMLDRHAGQRNVTVLQAPPGAKVPFRLEFNNIFPHATTAVLTLRSHHLALTQPVEGLFAFNEALSLLVAHGITVPAVRASAQRRAAILATRPLSIMRSAETQTSPERVAVREIAQDRGLASIVSSIDERSAILVYPDADAYIGRLYLAREASTRGQCCAPPMTRLHEVPMRAFEQRYLTLELGIPDGARPGEFIVFHVMQENDGFQLGGYTVVIHVVENAARARHSR
jgi:hypothetical protein